MVGDAKIHPQSELEFPPRLKVPSRSWHEIFSREAVGAADELTLTVAW